MQLGLWFNEYDKEKMSNFLFDERDCTGSISKANQDALCEPSGAFTIMGFWINDNIKIGTVDNLEDIDYVVSKSKLNLELIKETKNGIFLYKVNRG
ncbi:MAG: hypothetical protein KKA79_07140 [Nanoarchaeota archaeon]|nr:hypothetical protein [Nanoarchaeota archaeon]